IFLALKEYLSLIPTRRVDRSVLLLVYLTIPVQLVLAAYDRYGLFLVFIPVWAYLLITMAMVLIGKTHGYLRAVGTISWGLMLTVFALSHIAYLMVVGERANPVAGGAGLLFFLLFLTQFNDVAQYVSGRTLGPYGVLGKVLPAVSPNKTWEGLLGGIVTTMIVAGIVGPLLTPMPWLWSVAAGAVLAIAGFLGDVTWSAFKRDLGVKDTSTFIPGHGGVLDRVDSLTFASPVFTHAFIFFFAS
ncbi:MAG: phosphatidate cytidylyltransferase, partial [Pseudomonadota bacterium]